jgi:hypothetical protein
VAFDRRGAERRAEAAEHLQIGESTHVSQPHGGGTLLALLAAIQLCWFAVLAFVLLRLGV